MLQLFQDNPEHCNSYHRLIVDDMKSGAHIACAKVSQRGSRCWCTAVMKASRGRACPVNPVPGPHPCPSFPVCFRPTHRSRQHHRNRTTRSAAHRATLHLARASCSLPKHPPRACATRNETRAGARATRPSRSSSSLDGSAASWATRLSCLWATNRLTKTEMGA